MKTKQTKKQKIGNTDRTIVTSKYFHSVYFTGFEKVDEIQSCLGGDSQLKFTGMLMSQFIKTDALGV